MKTITIGWLNKCRCGNKSHTVKTSRGNETALWDDDAVKCNSCGRGGVIQVCEGQARVLWETDEEMAENKPMSTITKEFTKEQLQQIEAAAKEVMWPVVWSEKKAREHFSEKITPKVVLKLARIALASLEAEAVADVVAWSSPNEERTCDVRLRRHDINPGPLYTAPPAPVSVPDEMTMQKALSAINRLSWQECTRDAYMLGWNACRAAMLQGADGNSPVMPDGWVACSERMPDAETNPDVLVYCSDTKEQFVGFHIGRGDFQFFNMDDVIGACHPTHWMPLPAAPQQEVK